MGPDPPTLGNEGFVQLYKCEKPSLDHDQHGHSSPFASVLSSPSTLPSACSTSSIQPQTALASENSANIDRACAISAGPCGLLSQSTSLGSLPSLTFTPSCTDPSAAPPFHTQYHCIQTQHLLDGAGHISCLVSTAGGCYLYGASSSTSTLYVWSMEELNRGHQMQLVPTCIVAKLGHNVGTKDGGIRALVTIGEDMIVSAHDSDKKIRVWKRLASHNAAQIMHVAETLPAVALISYHSSLKLLSTMPTLKDYLRTFLLSKNYVQVRRHHKKLWIEHADTISSLAVSRDKQLLYSASWDRSIKVWRLPEFKCLQSVKRAHEDAINCIVLSNDDKFLYTGSADAKIKVWRCQADGRLGGANASCSHTATNLKTMPLAQSMLSTLEGHRSAVNALALSPDGGVMYSGAGDKAIIVWEREESAAHMVIAGKLRGHRQAILCLATVTSPHHEMGCDVDSGQAQMFCSGSADKTIRLWKRVGLICTSSSILPAKSAMKQYKYWCVGVLEGHTAPVKCLSVFISDVLLYVYSASLDKTIKTWRISHTETPPELL